MIDEQNFYDQPVNCNLRTYHKIRKIVTGQRDTLPLGYFVASAIDAAIHKKCLDLLIRH